MLKKSLICTLAITILSLFCTVSFAAEENNKINLGNEIMRSIDKTGDSMQNVISGNVVKDAGNMINNGVNMVSNGINDVGNTVNGTVNNMDNRVNNGNDNRDNRNNNDNKAVMGTNGDYYNTTRTSTAQTLNNGINTMTATTWMWIILIVAAVTIMAAIWYYATQGNK